MRRALRARRLRLGGVHLDHQVGPSIGLLALCEGLLRALLGEEDLLDLRFRAHLVWSLVD